MTLLKVIATFLITWFHLKPYSPDSLHPLFIGGALGNSLFFFSSGYLIKMKKERFIGEWMLHKYIRIIPSVWIATVITILTGINIYWYEWIYPTHFWFVNAILCFFLIYWLFHKWIDKYPYETIIIISILHIIWYSVLVDHTFLSLDSGGLNSWFYNFIFFLSGHYISSKSISMPNAKNRYLNTILPIICIVLFYGYKTLCKYYPPLCFWQFILIPITLFVFTFYTYQLISKLANIRIPYKIQRSLSYISNMTLDIYVVQIAIMIIIARFNFTFPINIIIMLLCISITSYISFQIANLIAKQITNKIIKK